MTEEIANKAIGRSFLDGGLSKFNGPLPLNAKIAHTGKTFYEPRSRKVHLINGVINKERFQSWKFSSGNPLRPIVVVRSYCWERLVAPAPGCLSSGQSNYETNTPKLAQCAATSTGPALTISTGTGL
jgi:hypothetical protein